MRFFIALEIPEQSRNQLAQVQQQLKLIIPQSKLTDSTKFHLTIAFVGEHDPSLKDPLIKILADATANIPPFSVTPAYIDGFPSLHNAKILWMGVKGDIDKLVILRERIKDGLYLLKLETDERRFLPHIALAKNRIFKITPPIEREFENIAMQTFNPIQVTSIKLFESAPDHGFHSHNTLAEVKLT